MDKKVLVTGSGGYIGSHVVLELLKQNFEVVGVDSVVRSGIESHDNTMRAAAFHSAGREFLTYHYDVRDEAEMRTLIENHDITQFVHCAGWKAVGESVQKPLEYWTNNVEGLRSTLSAMMFLVNRGQTVNFVFSSSATVYGAGNTVIQSAFEEGDITQSTNPYGSTKIACEQMLQDLASAYPNFHHTNLRYFNPAGSDESGFIGDDPRFNHNNLFPVLGRVMNGALPHLTVFGDSYETRDGTCIRDYVHVTDLACAHIEALRNRSSQKNINLGTQTGYTVLEVHAEYERAAGTKIPLVIAPPRAGDVPSMLASTWLAGSVLGWSARRDLRTMCESAVNYVRRLAL